MPLTPPNLDDRTYADIVREARALIPRYTSDWTDFNDSDPGITLIQLFAWMTEQLIFRLNQVPDLNYLKFLQLLGIEPAPPAAAHADLTFAVSPTRAASLHVPAQTRVAAAGSPPAVFETDDDLWAVGALLDRVVVYDSFGFRERTDDNAAVPPGPPRPFPAFGLHTRPGAYLALGFQAPSGLPAPEQAIDLMVYVSPLTAVVEGRDCGADLSLIPPPATIEWEYDAGKPDWPPVVLQEDATRALTRSGRVRFSLPAADAVPVPLGPVEDPRYWIRGRLVDSSYERAPLVEQVLVNTVPATHAETIADEVMGGSTGAPNQVLRLANQPVLAGTAQVDVDEGSGPVAWQEVGDFIRSGPDDPHFTVDLATGDVTFGDGRHGRIPAPDPAQPNASIVAHRYRTGGGEAGNVAVGAIKALQVDIADLKGATNNRPAQGGAAEESLADARVRAPAELRSKGRAVTVEDFESLAVATPGARVKRARAIPRYDPRYPGVAMPGSVTVIVVPDGDAPNPMPNEGTLATVCAYLDGCRLLTTELHVVPPRYQLVKVTVAAVARSDAAAGQAEQLVGASLAAYLHPLTGGEDGTGWEFGGTIYASQLARRVLDVPGVDRIVENGLTIELDGVPQPPGHDVPLGAYALAYTVAGDNDVTVTQSWRPVQ
jgi:hypothetical protein